MLHCRADYRYNRITDIPPELLARLGIRYVFADLDNTLLPWSCCDSASILPGWYEWYAAVRDLGIEVCILSNGSGERVLREGELLGLPVIGNAGKPHRGAYRRAMLRYGAVPQECCAIGDQILTDINGAKRAGWYAVLTEPIARREFAFTRLNRLLELILYGRKP